MIASNGVTAIIDSIIPAPNPANTPLGPDNFPFSSASNFLIASKPRNRTLAFTVFPTTNAGHPTYNDPIPCVRATDEINLRGFREI